MTEDDPLERDLLEHLPSDVNAAGAVLMDLAGLIAVVEPSGHYDGVSATLPKVRLQPGERPADAARRAVRDKVGDLHATEEWPLRTAFTTSNSRAAYMVAARFDPMAPGPHPSPSKWVQAVRWLAPDAARQAINASPNPNSRARDLGVLDAAASYVGAARRLLLAVAELHGRGFGRLRLDAHYTGIAWRCYPVPSTGREGLRDLARHLGQPHVELGHSSSNLFDAFGWRDAALDTPSELADRLLARAPVRMAASWGPDPDYVRWFRQALDATAPFGVFAESEWPGQPIFGMRTPSSVTLPDPPPPR